MQLIDVTVRDGLQALDFIVPTELKVELIRQLVAAGICRLEVASFVSPWRVPQMADAEGLLARLDGIQASLSALVLNERGARRALETNVDQVNVVCIATDGLARANQGRSSTETVTDAIGIIGLLVSEGRETCATIGAAFGAPTIEANSSAVLNIVHKLIGAGTTEIVLADTYGVATPLDIEIVVEPLRAVFPQLPLRLHLHDPHGRAVENAHVGIKLGVSGLDCSLANLGGCPSTEKKSSNLSLEQGALLVQQFPSVTEVSASAICSLSEWIGRRFNELAGATATSSPSLGVQ